MEIPVLLKSSDKILLNFGLFRNFTTLQWLRPAAEAPRWR